MFRFVPPAGMSLELGDFAAGLGALGSAHPVELESIAKYTGMAHVFGVSTGRAGLAIALQAMKRLAPGRSIVAVPAYTCYSVAAAVVRAGLRVYPLEINTRTLDADYEQINAVGGDLLCVISASLFGFATDLSQARHYAQGQGAFVLEDAAQSLVTCTNGQLPGTGADVRLYSLARGKALPVGGGLVATNREDIACAVGDELAGVPSLPISAELRAGCELAAITLLLRPWLYWIPNQLPFIKLGATEFNPQFPVTRMSRMSSMLLPRVWKRMETAGKRRAGNAAKLRERLQCNRYFRVLEEPASGSPSYIRFPLIARNEGIRDWAVRELRGAGIGASAYYPGAVCDIPGIAPHLASTARHCPGAEELARTLLTLPVHPLVQDRDLEVMIAILNGCGS